MSQRDGAAVHVDLVAIEAEFLFHCEILTGEGFIHLDQIDVLEFQSGFLQRDPRSRHRA